MYYTLVVSTIVIESLQQRCNTEVTRVLSKSSILGQGNNNREAVISRPSPPERRRVNVSKLLKIRIRQARYLIGLLASLVVADGLISNYIMGNNFGTESNLLIESLVGQASFILLKIIAAILSAVILWKVFKQRPRLGLVSIILFVSIYTVILWWNLFTWFIGAHSV